MKTEWREQPSPRLILGTVQLGMPYGIANTVGQPSLDQTRSIVQTAFARGIRYFDTAQAYGESEQRLGEALDDIGASGDVFITSKLSASLDPENMGQIEKSIEESLCRLRVSSLWCMMLHSPDWLALWENGLGDLLKQYRLQGRIKHLGVSLRTAGDAEQCLSCRDIEVVQAPCNAWDRRMVTNGHLEKFRRTGRLCCVRSIYLQGLLAMAADAVGQRLSRAHEASLRWHDLARQLGSTPVELAMRFALTLNAPLVVGVESISQLEDTIRLAFLEPLSPVEIETVAAVMEPVLNIEIIEPRRWEQ